jgi:hypothetical protein
MRRRSLLVAAALLGLTVACTGDDVDPDEPIVTPTPTPSPTPTPTVDVERWPLTGLPAPDGVTDRPALVVKVDNTTLGRPQRGLAGADLIVEEPVEGGSTRLAAMYHSDLAELVAPVRSIRTTDLGIVTPIDGILVASGGAQRVLRMMDDAGVTVLVERNAGFARDASRSAPYNVTVDLEAALTEVADHAAPEIPYLEWLDDSEVAPDGQSVSSVDIVFSRFHTSGWDWQADDAVWLRRDDRAEPEDGFTPANVLVLHVVTRDAGYTDPGGFPVREVVFDEPGDALLLTNGVAIEGAWTTDGDDAAFVLTDEDGATLPVPPGRTWVALLPEGGTVTTDVE